MTLDDLEKRAQEAKPLHPGDFVTTWISADELTRVVRIARAAERLEPLVMAALLQDAIDREEGNAALIELSEARAAGEAETAE